jgi:predicted DNA-binding transcriptional regulator YafY
MATNKNAILRYNTLDKCFQNFGRKYYFDDLLETVNNALFDYDPKSSGIKTRQLRDDIKFMKSEEGYFAPIEAFPEGKKSYYRYDNRDFSINNSPLNSTEAEQLKNAISVLQRFEGSPEFEWVNELTPLLNDKFGLKDESKKVMEFDSNIDYTGHEHITPLFNAIINQNVVNISYQPFGQESNSIVFHAYYLKQYNNRWFAFGENDLYPGSVSNLALDRIISIEDNKTKYKSSDINWEEYFDDIVGVSKPTGIEVQKIELLFSSEQAPYIQTKPLHLSQKHKLQEDGKLLVKLEVIPNYELTMKILAFGEKVKVLAPDALVLKVKERIKLAANQY